jgi:hypothetical protein
MAESLRSQIARLRELAPRLNDVTDKANRLVQIVEKLLGEELSLGVSGSAVISDHAQDGNRQTVRLLYSRYDGKFRLHIHDYTLLDDGQEFETNTVWSSAARDVKLAAFQKIPDLLADITQKVEQAIEQTEGAGRTIQDLIAAIGPKQEAK